MSYTEYVTSIQPETKTADDIFAKVGGTRDGAAFSADWVLARCKEGRVYVANVGTATGPASFGAGIIDTTEFDLFVSVPENTTVIPLELSIQVEAWGTVALFETMAIFGSGGVTGAGSSVTPKNIRTDLPNASLCTITSSATAASGTAITGAEFFRAGHIITLTPTTASDAAGAGQRTKFQWSHKDAGYSPIIVGAGQLGVFVSGQASTGFITLVYVEIPSTRIV